MGVVRVNVEPDRASLDHLDLSPFRVLDHANVIQASRHDRSLSRMHPARPAVEIAEDDHGVAEAMPVVDFLAESLFAIGSESPSLRPVNGPVRIQYDNRGKARSPLTLQDLRDHESPGGELR